jgi:hypothetical protein
MCIPGAYAQQSSGSKTAPSSPGHRLHLARLQALSSAGGGTFDGKTVLTGVPRNSGVDALRKTMLLGV